MSLDYLPGQVTDGQYYWLSVLCSSVKRIRNTKPLAADVGILVNIMFLRHQLSLLCLSRRDSRPLTTSKFASRSHRRRTHPLRRFLSFLAGALVIMWLHLAWQTNQAPLLGADLLYHTSVVRLDSPDPLSAIVNF